MISDGFFVIGIAKIRKERSEFYKTVNNKRIP